MLVAFSDLVVECEAHIGMLRLADSAQSHGLHQEIRKKGSRCLRRFYIGRICQRLCLRKGHKKVQEASFGDKTIRPTPDQWEGFSKLMMSEVPIPMNWAMWGPRKEREEGVNMTEIAINGS